MIICRLAAILGERRALRQEPFTFSALAEATGLHPDTVGNLANNKTQRYDAPVLNAICRELGVEVGELLIRVPSERDNGRAN